MTSLRTNHPILALLNFTTSLKQLKQIHAQLLINNLLKDRRFLGQFIALIAHKNPKNLDYSNQVLDQCENPSLFGLNAMIKAHSKSSTPQKSFHFFNKILRTSNGKPDNYTLNFLVRACAQLLECETAQAVHYAVIKHGFESDSHVQSGLIYMYSELGCLGSCRQVFDLIPEPCLVCQTTMVSAYAKDGDITLARELFDSMSEKDPIAWNAMITGYAQCGKSSEALRMFRLMQLKGVEINDVSMVLVLSACSHLGASDHGRWAHAYIERNKIPVTVELGTALIDMYAKCGNLNKAMEVFWSMGEKNVYTWSSAMNGLAMNGAGNKCLELFSRMKEDGVSPNGVTFVSVLRACSVVGLVEEGQKHFESMTKDYGIQPRHEHYGCLVDLYGRAGRLEEALSVIKGMPIEPHTGAWGALLNACKLYNNMELGELASQKIIELEGKNHGAYVLLSNIYADLKDWESVDNVRQTMKAKGVKKEPGCSAIEVDGEVHEFFVGDYSHPRYSEIEVMLGEMSRRLKSAGYVANTNPVLFDIEEEDKENVLHRHSEKVAIAFGLISLKEFLPIKIVKNLRICWDCHDAAKMISKVFRREVIIRDRNRFHHFKDGDCSCNGYW